MGYSRELFQEAIKIIEKRKSNAEKDAQVRFEELSAIDRQLAGIVVERFEPGCPSSLAKIPAGERRSFASPGGRMFFALCDNRKTVLEILLTCEAVFKRRNSTQGREILLEHLKYLEKYGYIKLHYNK